MNHNLKTLIKAQIAKYPNAGPEELAMYVAQATPAVDVKTFYAHLLVGACRTVANQHRERIKPKDEAPRSKLKPKPSPKLEERRTWWAAMLHKEMQVAGGISKLLGDCTVEDLRYCIKERDQAIGRIEEQMSNLNHLIRLMSQHRATRVRDLPPQQQWRAAS